MLSHLRFHRRGSSNPTSPIVDQKSPRDIPPQQQQQQQRDVPLSPDARPASSNSSTLPSLPHTLPPITRVASIGASFDLPDFSTPTSYLEQQPRDPPLEQVLPHHDRHQQVQRDPARDPPRPTPMRSPYDQGSGFIGGVALEKYRREEAARRQESSDPPSSDNQHLRVISPQQSAPLTSPGMPVSNKPSPSFVSPTDLRNSAVSPTGKMPSSNVKMRPSDPYQNVVTVAPMEPPRGKKGLPFLKNPMSTLLMRRKASQDVPDILPLPLQNTTAPSYDPRIRGTRVHDFSAPRPRKPATPTAAQAATQPPVHDTLAARKPSDAKPPPIPDKSRLRPPLAEPDERSEQPQSRPGRQPSSGTNSTGLSIVTSTNAPSTRHNATSSVSSRSSLKPSLDKPLPPIVPPKDNVSAARLPSTSSTAARATALGGPKPNHNGSVISTQSRHSRVDVLTRESLSSIPKHMKSTSSRFSFDMVGAENQEEKLLEDRHRQRQLDRGAAGSSNLGGGDGGYRDSRFDDLDDFDYDAMMDDDGLEERIPGVNADYDYEEEPIPGMEDDFEEPIPEVNFDYDEEVDEYGAMDDPDNDQENFAGFVFERSPQSALPTPRSAGYMATPRDAEGNPIGFALSKDSPRGQMPPPNPEYMSPQPDDGADSEDLGHLGTRGPDFPDREVTANEAEMPVDVEVAKGTGPADRRDDLYFDDGMLDGEFADELDFPPSTDGVPFDEALFDLNDTDKYGRPIPGAFKAAKEAYVARHDQNKRESDMTSGQFDQSAMSPSTTRTSISAAPGPLRLVSKPPSEEISPQRRSTAFTEAAPAMPATEEDRMEAYQAALAAAACRAAEVGKFRHDSPPGSPELYPAEVGSAADDDLDAYDDEPSNVNFDDYEMDDLDLDLDDDDIIAEANASALANDAEGWYGHEFGFYSSPAPQHGSLPFEYVNGGYFGPSGQAVGGGRAVSREPNLTPITERSEYSNRNSVMSLGVPPVGSGPSTSIQSPGLVQLAMMADNDDNMTLSALLRLRSKAWGGSQASLVSSRDGSPRSERGEGASSPQQQVGAGFHHARKGSSFSVPSKDETSHSHSLPGSPTLTGGVFMGSPISLGTNLSLVQSSPANVANGWSAQTPVNLANGPSAQSLFVGASNGATSPCEERSAEGRRAAGHHRHKGSAGSISYVKEEESGETRWVVERRRIDEESGEVEVLEREVLPGARI
ncbi:uncharacterized protein DNG_07813 [Cephalotrichum gorgonifer]|uniref:AGC-kinase C-terminal domain-containing protein n=1 Tax=Cephalotrichum gorgonifer TaxID=2041049 RepID=A0AAE8SXT5_9PEZI|nr:uncharacterized protein DNG_07813 [Cephalotrichum gorgonifer]